MNIYHQWLWRGKRSRIPVKVRELNYHRSIKYSLCITHKSCDMSANYYGLPIRESLHETPPIEAFGTFILEHVNEIMTDNIY